GDELLSFWDGLHPHPSFVDRKPRSSGSHSWLGLLIAYGTAVAARCLLLWPVVSRASQKRLAGLGMVAPRFFYTIGRHLAQRAGASSGGACYSFSMRGVRLNGLEQR